MPQIYPRHVSGYRAGGCGYAVQASLFVYSNMFCSWKIEIELCCKRNLITCAEYNSLLLSRSGYLRWWPSCYRVLGQCLLHENDGMQGGTAITTLVTLLSDIWIIEPFWMIHRALVVLFITLTVGYPRIVVGITTGHHSGMPSLSHFPAALLLRKYWPARIHLCILVDRATQLLEYQRAIK